jgi:hypothetical protein
MKKFLFFLTLIISSAIYNYTIAQCTISDLKVRLIEVNTSTCEVTFDLSWTQEVNSGNKFAYIHFWTQPAYHTPAANWQSMYSNPDGYPRAEDLVNVLSTIVIDDNHADKPFIGTVYHPDPLYVLPEQPFLSVVKVHLNNTSIERMTVKNVKLQLPSCAGAQTIYFDIWASQGQNGKNVHCASPGATFILNEVRPIGAIVCTTPRQFEVFIKNTGPALEGVQYIVYLDKVPVGIVDPTDIAVFSSDVITLPANGIYTAPVTGYLPYSNDVLTSGLPLIVEVTVPLWTNTMTATLENGCGPLSVKFNSFTAQQVKNKVVLNWQTATEQNNRGFEIERKLAGENYKAIGFIPSRSTTGNSNQVTGYSFEDANNLSVPGQVFYRLKQIDFDGNSSFSEVRFVNYNMEETTVFIYPNPANGFSRVILPSGVGVVDMSLHDASGKEVRRWNSVVNQLLIEDLSPGIFMLRIVFKATGLVQAHKLIVL